MTRYSIIFALWVTAYLLRAVFLFVAARKNRLKELPIFFSYLGFTIIETIIAISIRYHTTAYDRLAAFMALTGVVLEISVIYELANLLLSPHLNRRFQQVKRWIFASLLLIATTATAVLPQRMPWNRVAVNVDFFANVLELGLILILLVVVRILGLSWPRLFAGVALGIGISSAVGAAIDTVFSQWGSPVACDIIEQSVSVLTATVWLAGVLMPEKSAIFKETALPLSNLDAEASKFENAIRG